jgi:elongation factor G
VATDPYVGRLCYVRVYSGVLETGMNVLNTRTGKKERISRLFQMHASKQNPMDVIGTGDICAVVGLKNIRTGDTLCDPDKPIVLEKMEFPDPVIDVAIEPKTQADSDKMDNALSKLME